MPAVECLAEADGEPGLAVCFGEGGVGIDSRRHQVQSLQPARVGKPCVLAFSAMKTSPGLQSPTMTADLHPLIGEAISRSPNPKIGPEKLLHYVPKTLQYLVSCALSKEPTSYAKICEKIGAGNPQNANWGFGSIHWILQLLQDEPKFSGVVFPDITSIVTNRDGKTAGRGAFRSNKTILDKSKKDQIEWLQVRRKDVFRFRRWPEVLAYLGTC